MASLPKKVFEHFSRGIIHKNEIYVYLFMTFTIVAISCPTGGRMITYKVFCKNYELKKGDLIGLLIERRSDLRGLSQVEAGLKWAKSVFGHKVKDIKSIIVVPGKLDLRSDNQWLADKGVFTREELYGISKLLS
jgi:hypothetical protein